MELDPNEKILMVTQTGEIPSDIFLSVFALVGGIIGNCTLIIKLILYYYLQDEFLATAASNLFTTDTLAGSLDRRA